MMVALDFLKVLIKEFFTFLAALSRLVKCWGTIIIRRLPWRLLYSIFVILMHLTSYGILIWILLMNWWVQGWAHLASVSSSGINRSIGLETSLGSVAMRGFLAAVKTRGALLMMSSIHGQWKQIHLRQLFWSTTKLVFDGRDSTHINFSVHIVVTHWKLNFTESASIWKAWAAILIQYGHNLRIGSRTLQRVIPGELGPWFLSRRCFQVVFGEKW